MNRYRRITMLLVFLFMLGCVFPAVAYDSIPYRALKDQLTYPYITLTSPAEFKNELIFDVLIRDNECSDLIIHAQKGLARFTKANAYSFLAGMQPESLLPAWDGVKVEHGNRVEISYTPTIRDGGALEWDILFVTCLNKDGQSLQTYCLTIEQIKDSFYSVASITV